MFLRIHPPPAPLTRMEPWTGQVSMSLGNDAEHLVAPHVPPHSPPGLTVKEPARLLPIVAYLSAFPDLMVHSLLLLLNQACRIEMGRPLRCHECCCWLWVKISFMATLQRPELHQARKHLFWAEDTVHVAQPVLLCSVGGQDCKCID